MMETILLNSLSKIKSKHAFVLLFIFIFAGSALPAKAGDVAIGTDAQFLDITPFLDVYKDVDGKLGIEDVSSGRAYNEFIPIRSSYVHTGSMPSTYWFKVRIGLSQGLGKGSRWLIEIPKMNMGEITMYVPDFTKSSGYYSEIAPSFSMDTGKAFIYPNTVFPISPSMAGKTIFFKMKSDWPSNVSFYVWEDSTYRIETIKRSILFALACGIILATTILSLFMLSARNCWTIAFFAVYNFLWLAFLFKVRGYSSLLLNDSSPFYQSMGIIICGICITALALTINLLNLKKNLPKFYRFGLRLPLLAVVALISSFMVPDTVFITFTVGIAILYGLFTLIVSRLRTKQGSQSAVWYFLSWIFLYVGIGVYVATGYLWPTLLFLQNILLVGTSLSSIFICIVIIVEFGVKDLKSLGETESISDLELYDISTGLYSRIYFISRFTEEINHTLRIRQPLSLLLIKLDCLKQMNQKYGLLFSDQVIVALGEIIKKNALRFSAGARLEGGLFALQLPETPLKDALGVAEEISASFSSIKFSTKGHSGFAYELDNHSAEGENLEVDPCLPEGQAVDHTKEYLKEINDKAQFTVCIGVVEVGGEESKWEQIIKRAEEELQKAQDLGLNNISPNPNIRDFL